MQRHERHPVCPPGFHRVNIGGEGDVLKVIGETWFGVVTLIFGDGVDELLNVFDAVLCLNVSSVSLLLKCFEVACLQQDVVECFRWQFIGAAEILKDLREAAHLCLDAAVD